MKRRILNFHLLALVPTLLLPSTFVRAVEMHLRTAAVEITPPIGWRMAGNYYEKLNTGVHDPLFAKAMVWKKGSERAALVILEVCSVGREVSDPARALASKRSGIPVENIIVAATHTHAGPEFYGTLRDLFHEKAVERHGSDPREPQRDLQS